MGLAAQLKRLTFDNDYSYTDDPDISSIGAFINLTSLNVGWKPLARLSNRNDHAALWRTLPSSLESTNILNIDYRDDDNIDDDNNTRYENVKEKLRALSGAREERYMPHLSSIGIIEQRIDIKRYPDVVARLDVLDAECEAVTTEEEDNIETDEMFW